MSFVNNTKYGIWDMALAVAATTFCITVLGVQPIHILMIGMAIMIIVHLISIQSAVTKDRPETTTYLNIFKSAAAETSGDEDSETEESGETDSSDTDNSGSDTDTATN
jgi:NAD/NADP transhydrogenase beta subunit